MDNEIRKWVKSRMDAEQNCIFRALNYTQLMFWKTRLKIENLNYQIHWHDTRQTAANEHRKKHYFRLSRFATKLRTELEATPEWVEFERLSAEHIIIKNACEIPFNMKHIMSLKRFSLAECIEKSADVDK